MQSAAVGPGGPGNVLPGLWRGVGIARLARGVALISRMLRKCASSWHPLTAGFKGVGSGVYVVLQDLRRIPLRLFFSYLMAKPFLVFGE